MKKNYTTPEITFQTLSTNNLSTSCTYQATYLANACPIYIEEWGETVFADYTMCDLTPADNVCYDVPLYSSNVFES